MSNPEPDLSTSKRWHWVALAGILLSVAFALFVAFYEDTADAPPNDAATAAEAG